MDAAPPRWSLGEALRPGIQAVRRFWPPFLLIQLAAGAFVAAYYQSAAVRHFADEIGAAKVQGGLAFSGIGGFIAGGVVPEIAKALTRRMARPDRDWLLTTGFNGFVYFIVALQVDLFYRFQSMVFGDGVDVRTIALKTFVDMGLFAPLLCMPTAVLIVEWRHRRWNGRETFRAIGTAWYRDRVVPAILPGWAFWIPFLVAVYALPLPLQMPLALLGEASWSIIFIFVASNRERS